LLWQWRVTTMWPINRQISGTPIVVIAHDGQGLVLCGLRA
jgi:hypothetical protein